jgi:hypothetical protein
VEEDPMRYAIPVGVMLAILCLGASPSATKDFTLEGREFELRLEKLSCRAVTAEPEVPVLGENTTDEVYVLVCGPGYRFVRLPGRDRHYQAKAGWDLEEKGWIDSLGSRTGGPVLWRGVCADHETVRIPVSIWEQDLNEAKGPESMAAAAGELLLEKCENDMERIEKVLDAKGDDLVGSFEVRIRNSVDKLEVVFEPRDYTLVQPAEGSPRGEFTCKSPSGSDYRGLASVKALRPLDWVRTIDVLASDAPWNEEKSVKLQAGARYLVVPSPSCRYSLDRMISPLAGYLDWYAGLGEIAGQPVGIAHEKLRLGGLAVLLRRGESETVLPADPLRGYVELPDRHGGTLLFCIVDRQREHRNNTGSLRVRIYRVN